MMNCRIMSNKQKTSKMRAGALIINIFFFVLFLNPNAASQNGQAIVFRTDVFCTHLHVSSASSLFVLQLLSVCSLPIQKDVFPLSSTSIFFLLSVLQARLQSLEGVHLPSVVCEEAQEASPLSIIFSSK